MSIPIQVDVLIKSIKIKNLHLGADPAALERLEISLNELKEIVMAQGDELKREIQETKAQGAAVATALGTLNDSVNALKEQLLAAANGLTAEEAAEAAATLEASQVEVNTALEAAGFTPPGEPGPDLPIPLPE